MEKPNKQGKRAIDCDWFEEVEESVAPTDEDNGN